MRAFGAFTSSGSENVGAFSLNVVHVFESPNIVLESGRLRLPPEVYTCGKGSGLYIAKGGCVIKHPPFQLEGPLKE